MTGKRFGSKNIDMVKLGREEASNLIKVDLVWLMTCISQVLNLAALYIEAIRLSCRSVQSSNFVTQKNIERGSNFSFGSLTCIFKVLECRTASREFREISLLSLICFCLRVRFAYIGAFGFEWFFFVLLFVLHILLVNILRVVFAGGCKLIKPNHLNLGVLCDCVIFYYAIIYFFVNP
jgi:hypothetical protein